MGTRKQGRFAYFFVDHVFKFMKKAGLFPPSGCAVVAVSGGMDSVALMDCLYHIFQKGELLDKDLGGKLVQLKVLHINHQTRKENLDEARLVARLADERNLEFKEVKLPPWNPQFPHQPFYSIQNFEHRAREKRYGIFKDFLGPGDFLYTAHHIDDSFEWSLMQQLKSSSPRTTLGIPVRNKNIVRPFLCVTKRQIASYIKIKNLSFLEDASNKDYSFQRNFLRHKIIRPLEGSFSNFLKHYVDRSNLLAMEWRCSIFQVSNCATNSFLYFFQDTMGIRGYLKKNPKVKWTGNEEKIRRLIHALSHKGRGTVQSQIQKFLEERKGQSGRGPYSFSGGVSGYRGGGYLGILGRAQKELLDKKDHEFANILEKGGLAALQSSLVMKEIGGKELMTWFDKRFFQMKTGEFTFPFWIFSTSKRELENHLPSLRIPYPLWPKMTKYLIDYQIWFRAAEDLWSYLQKKEKNFHFQTSTFIVGF